MIELGLHHSRKKERKKIVMCTINLLLFCQLNDLKWLCLFSFFFSWCLPGNCHIWIQICSSNSDEFCGQTRFLIASRHCAVAILFKVLKLFSDSGLMQICMQFRTAKRNASARRLLSPAMLERSPHVCRIKITFALLLTNWSVSSRMNSVKCLVNWIPRRTRVCFQNT